MGLDFRQQRQLDRIESRLRRSDPHLAGMLTIFVRLSARERMPVGEQISTRLDRLQRAAALVTRSLAAMALTIGLLVSGMLTTVSLSLRPRARAPQPARQQAFPPRSGS